MKNKNWIFFWTALAALGCAALLQAQSSTNAPVRDLVITTNTSTNLNATSVRVTIQDVTLDPTSSLPLLTILIEAWGTDVDNGVTNKIVIGKKTFTLTTTQMKALYAAADPKAFMTTAVLNKVGLTQKP